MIGHLIEDRRVGRCVIRKVRVDCQRGAGVGEEIVIIKAGRVDGVVRRNRHVALVVDDILAGVRDGSSDYGSPDERQKQETQESQELEPIRHKSPPRVCG